MRVSALLWPFPFLLGVGKLTTSVPNIDVREARGRAYLLRGNGIVFSRGFGRTCDRLRLAGLWAEDLRCVGDRWVRRHLRAEVPRTPIILVGHSCGGRYALHAAQELARENIPIDLLIC